MKSSPRMILVVGGIALVVVIACPPWSYYQGEQSISIRTETDAGDDAGSFSKMVSGVQVKSDYRPIHVIRALAIIGIFVTTVVAYLKCGSQTEPSQVRRIVFWTVAWCAFLALIVPVTILVVQLVRWHISD